MMKLTLCLLPFLVAFITCDVSTNTTGYINTLLVLDTLGEPCSVNTTCTSSALCDNNRTCRCKVSCSPTFGCTYCNCSAGLVSYNCQGICRADGVCCYQIDDCPRDNMTKEINFMIAAKVALGSALIITMIAVFAIFWKTCFRNRFNTRSRPPSDADSVSLNSVQRYIISRLRDRPPRYDTEASLGKPPPYEECVRCESLNGDTISSDPPPYTSLPSNLMDAESPLPIFNTSNDANFVSLPLNVFSLAASHNPVSQQTDNENATDVKDDDLLASPVTDMDGFVVIPLNDTNNEVDRDSSALIGPSMDNEAAGFINDGFEEIGEELRIANSNMKHGET